MLLAPGIGLIGQCKHCLHWGEGGGRGPARGGPTARDLRGGGGGGAPLAPDGRRPPASSRPPHPLHPPPPTALCASPPPAGPARCRARPYWTVYRTSTYGRCGRARHCRGIRVRVSAREPPPPWTRSRPPPARRPWRFPPPLPRSVPSPRRQWHGWWQRRRPHRHGPAAASLSHTAFGAALDRMYPLAPATRLAVLPAPTAPASPSLSPLRLRSPPPSSSHKKTIPSPPPPPAL